MTLASIEAEGLGLSSKIVEKIFRTIDSYKRHVTIESQELSLKVPDSTGEYSVALTLRSGFFGGKMQFNIPDLIRLDARSSPTFKREDQAILKDGDSYVFDASKISKETHSVFLRFEFKLRDPRFLDSVVKRNWQLDTHGQDPSNIETYWMTAQIRHPAALRGTYSKLELLGVDLLLDVGVHQDIKTAMPPHALRAMERGGKFIGASDREKLYKLMIQQRREAKSVAGLPNATRRLLDLFMPNKFKRFVEVTQQFSFHECFRGTELFESSMLVALPRFMTVVSRTDLSLETQAKEGKLMYYKGKVRDEITQIFSAGAPITRI